jgi:hypothetical protein
MNLMMGMLPGNTTSVIGIDPGVNFGLTLIHDDEVMVHWGSLPPTKIKGEHGIHAYDFIYNTYQDFPAIKSVVEGAAYHSKFGQVGLEEVRFAFYLALRHLGMNPVIVPPATVRKAVFGNGQQQAGDVYPFMNHNGADSLSIALYSLETEELED